MQPANYDLSIYHGDSGHWRFTLTQQDGTPCDLDCVVAKSQIRDKPGGTALLVTMDCTITLPNVIDVILTPENSFKLTPKGGAWDLQLTYPSGEIKTPVAGAVAVTEDVTDSTPYVGNHRG